MHKVIKILGKAAAAVILLAIFLPLTASLLLDLPSVQNAAVDWAASWASRKIGTTVSIDRVDIGLFNQVRLRGLYVEDLQHDTLLYVGRLSGHVTGFGLLGGGVTLRSAELHGVQFNLRETPDGVMNIKQVVDRLSRRDKKKKGNFSLTITSLDVDSLDLRIERLAHRNPEYGIDFGDMELLGTQAAIEDFGIHGSAITATVSRFSSTEKSGFALDDFTGGVFVDKGVIRLTDAAIRTARSSLDIPQLSLAGDDWSDFKYFVDSVALDGSFRRSTLASDDVAYFSPKLRQWHLTLTDIGLDVQGMVSDFYADISRAGTGQSTSLSLKGSVKGLPDIRSTHFDLDIRRVRTTEADLRGIAKALTGRSLPDNIARIASRAGKIGVSGTFRGRLSSFTSRAALTTDAGRADLNLRIRPEGHGTNNIMGNVTARGLDLGRLLDAEILGRTSLAVHVDGDIGRDKTDAEVNGKITQLEINGYPVDSVRLDGRIRDRSFDGRIRGRNEALHFDFDGQVAMDGEVPRYDFCLDLVNADLARLGINRRDSVRHVAPLMHLIISKRFY